MSIFFVFYNPSNAKNLTGTHGSVLRVEGALAVSELPMLAAHSCSPISLTTLELLTELTGMFVFFLVCSK